MLTLFSSKIGVAMADVEDEGPAAAPFDGALVAKDVAVVDEETASAESVLFCRWFFTLNAG